MSNPNGPYPGRQIFLGRTQKGNPCFAYLVTGRSPQSRERRATKTDHSIIMGPVGNEPYDWLRHYTAVMTDKNIGLAAVTNGIQTEAVFETYRLIYHANSVPGIEYIYVLSAATYQSDDMRVCTIGGVLAGDKKTWQLSMINRNGDE